MSGYLKTFQVNIRDKDKSNKLISFRRDDDNLLEKFKINRTKIEDLDRMLYQSMMIDV